MAHRKCLLLTGATGFIGSHAAMAFAREGSFRVVAIVRRLEGYKNTRELEQAGVTLVEGSFLDHGLLSHTFDRYPVDQVIHLAALRGAGGGDEDAYHRVNVAGTEALLDAAQRKGAGKFIFCSSVGVHGTIPAELPAGPDSALNGDTGYHRSKIEAEKIVQRYVRQGAPATIVRPTITYGPGDTGFPATLVSLVRRRRLLLPRRPVLIHLLSVAGLCRLLQGMIRCPAAALPPVLIAADRAPLPLRDLADAIHRRYYGSGYPAALVLPGWASRLLSRSFDRMGNEKWLTRIELITKSWHYRIDETASAVPDCQAADTRSAFLESMCP